MTFYSEKIPEGFQLLAKSAPPLMARGVVISACQFFVKRAVYAQADETLLATYGIYSIIEGFVFLLVFRGLRIVSSSMAHLHAEEKNNVHFDPKEVGLLYRRGVLLGSVMMVAAAGLCIAAPTLFTWMQQPSSVIENAPHYFFYGFLGYLGDMLYRSRARIDIGRGKALYALYGDMCESVLDAIGTYVFVLGKCGFPNLGVAGGAVAYAMATWITVCAYHVITWMRPGIEKYHLYNFSLSEYRQIIFSDAFRQLFISGIQIAFKFSVIYLTVGLTTLLCSWQGVGASVGLQAAIAYSNLVVLPIGGLTDAAATVVGRFFKEDWRQSRRVGNVTIALSACFAFFSGVALLLKLDYFTTFFIKNDANNLENFAVVKKFLCVQAGMEVINSFGNSGASVLMGCLKTSKPFWLSIAFIFFMNSTLSSFLFYLKYPAVITYGVQMLGALLTSIGVLFNWEHQNKQNDAIAIPDNRNNLWVSTQRTLAVESPRKYDEGEQLTCSL